MRSDLEDRLREKYPPLFRHLRADPRVSPLGWGIEVQDGWYDLLDRLCAAVTGELAETPDADFCFEQVKQKFGVLRVHTSPAGNPRVADLIAAASDESRTTCEHCGATAAARVTDTGYWQTLCPACREKLR